MKARTVLLSAEEQERLEAVRDHDAKPWRRERAGALLKVAAGLSAHAVALGGLLKRRDPDTLYRWLDAYEAGGLEMLLRRRPSRRRFSPL